MSPERFALLGPEFLATIIHTSAYFTDESHVPQNTLSHRLPSRQSSDWYKEISGQGYSGHHDDRNVNYRHYNCKYAIPRACDMGSLFALVFSLQVKWNY